MMGCPFMQTYLFSHSFGFSSAANRSRRTNGTANHCHFKTDDTSSKML